MLEMPRAIRFGGPFLAVLLAGGAQGASQVELDRDGKKAALPHVTAVRFVDASGKAEIRLLFSSVKPENVVLADAFGGDTVHEWGASGKGSTVKVTFEEAAPEQYSMAVYHAGKMSSGGGTRISGDVKGVVRGLEVKADKVAGAMDVDSMGSVLKGAFDAALATVTEAKPVKGAAVAATPQARALLDFARAMNKKDFAAAQRYSAREVKAQMEEARREMGEEFVNETLKEFEPRALEASLKSEGAELLESGDTAKIRLVTKTEGGTSTRAFTLIRAGGDWKVQ